jgi:membrane protein implicated in regulation of membrane protease activity
VILLLFVVLAFFVPWPWTLLVLAGGIVLEIGEITWGRRLARRWRAKTGAEAMVGRVARVVEACRPDGRVRIDGELWQASCPAGADVGESVRVERVRGLTLDVVPVADADPGSSQRDEVSTVAKRLS